MYKERAIHYYVMPLLAQLVRYASEKGHQQSWFLVRPIYGRVDSSELWKRDLQCTFFACRWKYHSFEASTIWEGILFGASTIIVPKMGHFTIVPGERKKNANCSNFQISGSKVWLHYLDLRYWCRAAQAHILAHFFYTFAKKIQYKTDMNIFFISYNF